MFADRFEVTLTLKTLTSLHVGSGESKTMAANESASEAGRYAAIVRDHQGLPYIPATAIKGAMRRLAEDYYRGDAVIDDLFGTIKGIDAGSGSMGKLLFRAAICRGGLPAVKAMPFASMVVGEGTYIAARTAIDGASGVAEDHKLFLQEMVPPGVTFGLSLTLLDFGHRRDSAAASLKQILALLLREGVMLGKGEADGQGQIAVSDVNVRHLQLNPDGALRETSKDIIRAATQEVTSLQAKEAHRFELECLMPFAVVDSSVKGAGRELARDSGTVQVAAQRLREGMPLIHGSSIAGVIRSRAVWLSRLMVLNQAKPGDHQAVEELFGSSDWKALVDIKDLKVSEAREENITSLRVDRFTGAPVFGALYTTAAFSGVRLSFSLVLRPRPPHNVSKPAQALFARLVEDIHQNGLQLGHGINKGFGWFTTIGGKHAA